MRPDPVKDEFAERQKHYDSDADTVFVNTLEPGNTVGYAVVDNWHKIIVEYSGHSDPLRHVVIAHEFGHGVGLEHNGHVYPQVMRDTVSSDNVEQTLADANAYD